MSTKIIFLLSTLLFGAILVDCQGDSGEDDDYPFVMRWNISSGRVDELVEEADRADREGLTIELDSDGYGLILRPPVPRCEDGPVGELFRERGVWYWPPPIFTRCKGLKCPRDYTCVAKKTCRRRFRTLCFKQFKCFGKLIWIPVGLKKLCLTDEDECKCKPRCDPFKCFDPRYFDPKTCHCKCRKIKCRRPFELDPSSCQCRCPKDIICRRPYILDPKTCKCVCGNKCPPGYKPDPKQNCKCVQICNRRCPRGSYLDRVKCKCVGDCDDFRNEYDCNAVDSCRDYRDQKCRWFPTFPHNRCQCECCVKKDPYSNFDCGQYTPWGKSTCNYYYDSRSKSNPCKWVCGH